MQRTSFDVNSIAALLRQTEANLAALKPRQEAQRYSGEPIFSSTLPYTSSAPVRSQLGSGVELETQVVQLRTCIETLERRLEEELRSFLAISDKRLQAREEQLRGIGETLQASADAAMEQLNRRVDTRLHDLERAGLAPSALDEIWEALKRLEGDCQDLDGKLRRAASADDLADRFKEVERAQVQRFDERLATQEKRMSDMRLQLQTANEEFLQAINRRCEVLEKIVWEGQTDKGDIETVFKRLAEAAPIREMQEEINACNYEKEVQRTRLTTLEAKLSKQAALESKVDFMESQTSQQLEEQAQKFRHVSELQHKLSQKLASTEAASQRVEAQGASLQAKLQSQLDEERERMHSSFDALQQRVTKQLEEVEGRASRGSKRSEQDLVEHVNALTQKLMEESIAAQKQAEKRLHTVDERSDQVIQAARSQMEKAIQDLKMDAEVAKNAMDADLQRMDRFVQEIGSKMSTQEGQLVRLSDMDIQRSRIEAMESKLNEVQGEQRLLRDLKSIMDAHKLQADRRLGDLDSALASIEEQIREKDRRRNNDVDAHRARFEGFENRLTELQVSQVRHKTSVENLDIAVTSLEPLRATVTTLQGGLAAVEERIRSRAQELSQDMQQSWNSQNSLTQRVNAPHASSQASQGPKPGFDKPRRQRVTGKPATARASARSKDDEIQKVFNDIDTGGSGVLTLEDLQSYLCDHLGFGQAEAFGFMKTFGQGDGVSMEGFKKGYARLTPFLLSKRQNEVLIRKDGSLSSMGPQSLQIEELDDCEVYICEVTNTIFVDECKRSAMLIGPCETSVFVRDCEDCVFWIAAQQLRTRGCKRCKFFLYSKTEPVIEASQDLAFAPWSASYPCAKAHFKQFGFNPDVNLWNAIFDFSGKTGTSNWRILGLEEVFHIEVELEEPPPNPSPEDPAAPVTYEVLCAPPLQSGESCGQSVGSIPQTRPALPAAPPSTFSEVKQVPVQDGAKLSVFEQLKQSQSLKAAASGSSPESTGGLAMAALAGKTFMEVAGGSVLQNPKEEIKSDTGVSALGMASLAGQALMEAGTSGTMDVDDEDSSGETPRIKQLAPPASVTTLSGAHAKPKAAVTPAEVAGGSVLQNPKEEIKSDTGVSALGMASLAGQALMEAGTSVVGTMDVDDEDSSGETPRIKQLAPPASVTTSSGAHAKPKAVVTPAEVKKQLQKQLGESSDEEEELPQAKPKSMALPKARIARQIGDSEDDEDSDIERAMKKAAAEAARSRQAPGASGAGSSKTPLNTFAPASSSVQSEQKGLAASDSDDDNFFDDDEARSRQAPGASGAGSSKTPLNTFAPASSSVQSEQKGLAASDSDDDNFFDDDEELPM